MVAGFCPCSGGGVPQRRGVRSNDVAAFRCIWVVQSPIANEAGSVVGAERDEVAGVLRVPSSAVNSRSIA